MDSADLEMLNNLLEEEVQLKDKIRDQTAELDKRARSMAGMLNKIHSTPWSEMTSLLDTVQRTIDSCKDVMAALGELVPMDQFWRFKDMWSYSLRTAVFAVALVGYLRERSLVTLPQTCEILGITNDRLLLPAEDYLHGLITMVNELSRLAVNAVTMGNFEEPIRISLFVKDLFAGFSMLNLKNDTLRRRFDSLKYDIKKIEEVVYDVSLRNLAHKDTTESK